MEQNTFEKNTSKDLLWVADVYHGNFVASMPAAYEILKDYPVEELKTSADKFNYAELAALICHRLYKNGEATMYAKDALDYKEAIKSQLSDNEKQAALDVRLQQLSLIASDKKAI